MDHFSFSWVQRYVLILNWQNILSFFFVVLPNKCDFNPEKMHQTTRGVVLRIIRHKDSSFIADVYTDAFGRSSFILRNARTPRSKVPPLLFQPLSLIEMEADVRPSSTLHRITEAKRLYAFSTIPFHPAKQAIVLFLSEFLSHTLREEEQNLPLFEFLLHSIVFLDEAEQEFSNFHLVFMLNLSHFLGIYPNLSGYTAGDYFDLSDACFTPSRPLTHPFYASPDESVRIHALSRCDFQTMHQLLLGRMERNRLLSLLNEYYRLHFPNYPELKSLPVLHELFS